MKTFSDYHYFSTELVKANVQEQGVYENRKLLLDLSRCTVGKLLNIFLFNSAYIALKGVNHMHQFLPPCFLVIGMRLLQYCACSFIIV